MLGRNVQEATLRRKANTTPQDGTDEYGIVRALTHYGYKSKEINDTSRHRAWMWLKNNLDKARPVLLCVDDWGHWVSAVGTFGNQVIIFDPQVLPGKRRKYSGLKVVSEKDFGDLWAYTDLEDNRTYYYGIAVV